MSLANELWTLLQGANGTATQIGANQYRFAPTDNVCVIDITFNEQSIIIVGKNILQDEVLMSIRRPHERLINRFDIALHAIITSMRQLRDLTSPQT